MAPKGLFDLPRKVRDIIYGELLVKPRTVNIHTVMEDLRRPVLQDNGKATSGLALLRTSIRVCREASSILYGSNRLVAFHKGFVALYYFLESIGSQNRKKIKYLRFDFLRTEEGEGPDNESSTEESSMIDQPILKRDPRDDREIISDYEHYRCRSPLVCGVSLQTLLKTCCELLCDTWFETLELVMFPSLFREIGQPISNLKVNFLAIRGSSTLQLSQTLLQQTWVTQVVTISDGGNELERWPGVLKIREPANSAYLSHFNSKEWTIEKEVLGPREENKERDHFSRLPAETRNMIHELLFLQAHEIRPLDYSKNPLINSRKQARPKIDTTLWEAAGLLSVSHLIHREATDALYGGNVFRLLSRKAGDIPEWLQSIGRRNRKQIRYLQIDTDITLRESIRTPFPWVTGLSDFMLPERPLFADMKRTVLNAAELMSGTISESVADAANVADADFLTCLQMLEECTGLARLKLNVPRDHYLHIDDDLSAPYLMEAEVSQDAFYPMLKALPKLRIKTELQISNDYVCKDLEDVVRKMAIDEVVVFNNVVVPMDLEPPILDSDLDLLKEWTEHGCCQRTREKRLRLRRSDPNRLDRQIEKIWAREHDPGNCDHCSSSD